LLCFALLCFALLCFALLCFSVSVVFGVVVAVRCDLLERRGGAWVDVSCVLSAPLVRYLISFRLVRSDLLQQFVLSSPFV
jgi:hypothetical protein